MHAIFEKNGIVYKILRSTFGTDKDTNKFNFEASMLDFLSRYGIPTASVIRIYGPGELIPNYAVLAEKKILGYIYTSEELTVKRVSKIQSVLRTTHKISLDFFGPISSPDLQVKTWHEYINYLFEKAYLIQGKELQRRGRAGFHFLQCHLHRRKCIGKSQGRERHEAS